MSNQRRTAVGQGSSHGQLLAVGGQYLSGTTPNRANLIIYDTRDWSVWDSKVIGAETSIINDIKQDDNYIYLAVSGSPYFAIYIKATKELMTGIVSVTQSILTIELNDNWVYVCRASTPYRYAKGVYGAGTYETLTNAIATTNKTTSDANYIYGWQTSPNPDNLVRIEWGATTWATSSITGGDLVSQFASVNDDNNVYMAGQQFSANRFIVIRKSDNANITNTEYTTASTIIYAMTQDNDYVYFGVSNGEFRRVVKSTLVIEDTAQTFSSAIRCMLNLGDTIAVGGDFTDRFKLVPKSNLATTVSGTPALSGTVRSLCLIS